MNQTNAVYMNTQRMFYSCQSFSFKLQIIYSLHLTVFLFLATVQIRLQGEATVSKTCLVFFFFVDYSENKHLLPADRKPGEEPESLVGKQVEYVTDNGLKRTGLVIYQVPAKPTVYYIKYDDDVHIHVYDLVKTT